MKLNSLIVAALLTVSATANANLVTNGDFSEYSTGWTLIDGDDSTSFFSSGYWGNGEMGGMPI